MHNTTPPLDLFMNGFINGDKLSMSDMPVTYDARIFQIMQFIDKQFEKGKELNHSFDSQNLMQIYINATGLQISNGMFIYGMLKSGYMFDRRGQNGVFNVTTESVNRTYDKHMVQYLTKLPKVYLSFPGAKRFNTLDLRQKDGIIRDFLKYYSYPKPYTETWLLNKSDRMAIKFLVNAEIRVVEATALDYDEAVKQSGLVTEDKTQTIEATAF